MKQSIYIVTQGDYSSYEIVACFRTLESAQTYCRTVRLNGLRADLEETISTIALCGEWLAWLDDETRAQPQKTIYSRNLETLIGGHNPIVDMEWDDVNGGWIRMGREKQVEIAKIRFRSECQDRLGKLQAETEELTKQLEELPGRDFRLTGEYGENIIETHDLWDDPVPALEAQRAE